MIKALKERFGEANQADKYRLELKSRRRRPNETLRNLHSDILRLTALALPDFDHRARETMACDYFIDALDDPNLALKVRERFPRDLDAALRAALQLEVWSKSVDQSHLESTRKERRTREIAMPGKKDEQNDMLKKQVAELQKQLTELQNKDEVTVLTKRVAELEAHLTEAKSRTATELARNTALPEGTTRATRPRPMEFIPPREGTCWVCGDFGHRLWTCPKLSNAEKRKLDRRNVRPIGEHSRPVCIIVKYRGRAIPALVDTGCDVTIAASALAKKHHWKIRAAELQSVKTANGEHMLIEGIATVNLTVGKRNVRHEIHVTPDLTELIIGNDWMAKQGRLTWDYANHQVRFGDNE